MISLGNQCEGELHPTSDAYGAKLCCRNTFTGQTYDDLEYGINEWFQIKYVLPVPKFKFILIIFI